VHQQGYDDLLGNLVNSYS